jgi:tetratricopeptide (TPR) repeat protein
MKTILSALFIIVNFAFTCQAQDVRALVKEGLELNNARNYTGAIEKYKAALQLEPDNAAANYQLAFSLNAAGKGQEAIPYLQKVVQSNASAEVRSSAWGLLGGIYDQSKQAKYAIDSYQKGLQLDSASYAMHYGLGLAYFRDHQYAAAECSAINALRLDTRQADAFRLYGLVTFHQDKRIPALMAFCRYLQLQPNGVKSAEVYSNMQSILQGGALKPEPGVARPRPDANTVALNQVITQSATAMGTRRYASASDLLSAQLQYIFNATGRLAQKQTGHNTFFKSLTDYYLQLAQTDHMAAFARWLIQGTDKAAVAWLRAHPQQVNAMEEWMKTNIH